jgi:hypothetical protein
VVLVVGAGVLVDLDDDHLRIVKVRFDPLGVHQDVAAAHGESLLGGVVRQCCHGKAVACGR